MIEEAQSLVSHAERAKQVRAAIPAGGLFAGQSWRIAAEPFRARCPTRSSELESLGRVLLKFYRCSQPALSPERGRKQPGWVAAWLDQGKPAELIALQRAHAFKNELPRVIRPDILLTEDGFSITELDSVPGGIGLTAWLNQTYSKPGVRSPNSRTDRCGVDPCWTALPPSLETLSGFISSSRMKPPPTVPRWIGWPASSVPASRCMIHGSPTSRTAMPSIDSSSCSTWPTLRIISGSSSLRPTGESG